MVGQQLQPCGALTTEEGSVEEFRAGNVIVDHRDHQQNAAAQHGGGDQRCFQPGDGPPQHIGNQKAGQQDCGQIEKAPGTKVPKIYHLCHLISDSCIYGRSLRISAR